ncbi:hypothetical protein ACI65C_013615 [Semiaphis heraclei]
MIKLNLVKKLNEVNENIMDDPKYKLMSEGIGLIKVEEYDFKIQPGAVGNITYTSRVPFTDNTIPSVSYNNDNCDSSS